ncbi:sulfurtransferase [Intrasporangium oryzae]
MWAARLWWMLRTFGFDHAAVLDGGWTAGQQHGHAVCTTPCGYPAATFHATARPEMVVDIQAVLAALQDPPMSS